MSDKSSNILKKKGYGYDITRDQRLHQSNHNEIETDEYELEYVTDSEGNMFLDGLPYFGKFSFAKKADGAGDAAKGASRAGDAAKGLDGASDAAKGAGAAAGSAGMLSKVGGGLGKVAGSKAGKGALLVGGLVATTALGGVDVIIDKVADVVDDVADKVDDVAGDVAMAPVCAKAERECNEDPQGRDCYNDVYLPCKEYAGKYGANAPGYYKCHQIMDGPGWEGMVDNIMCTILIALMDAGLPIIGTFAGSFIDIWVRFRMYLCIYIFYWWNADD